MKKINLKEMTLLTSNFKNKIMTNYKDENGEEMFLEVKGLSLDDFGYLVDKIPKNTILNFMEGFSEKEVEDLQEYAMKKAQKSFSDIFYSVIAAGSQQYDEEETLKLLLSTPQALSAFNAIMKQTLPQNQEELDEINGAIDKISENQGKKTKAILNCFKSIVQIMISN